MTDARPKCDCPSDALSPSQIDTFLKCARRWGFRKLALRKEPETSSQAAGKEIHDRLEKYALSGQLPHRDEDKYAKPVWAAVPHLPAPHRFHVCEEHVSVTREAITIHGYPDLLPHTELAVVDYKTTSVQKPPFKFALTPERLLSDTQGMFYAYERLQDAAAADLGVNLRWIYIERQAPFRVRAVQAFAARGHIEAQMERIFGIAQKMYAHRVEADALGAEDAIEPVVDYVNGLPANTDHCGAYGGCPHRSVCKAYSPYAALNLGEKKMSGNELDSLMSRIKKNVPEAPQANAGNEVTTQAANNPEPDIINPPVEDAGHDDIEAMKAQMQAEMEAKLKAAREAKAAAEAAAKKAQAAATKKAAKPKFAEGQESAEPASAPSGDFQMTLSASGSNWRDCVQKIADQAQSILGG